MGALLSVVLDRRDILAGGAQPISVGLDGR
jgi:hypothetical protein